MLKPLLPTVDAFGFDVYVKVPTGFGLIDYAEVQPPFWKNVNRWKDFIKNNQKEAWIAESQAEPDKLVAIDKREYPSSDPNRAIRLASRLTTLGFNPVLLWGCEHWYWHRQNGNNEWWEAIVDYVDLPK